jgi:hypothetical protein
VADICNFIGNFVDDLNQNGVDDMDREKVEQGIKACWSRYFYHSCFECPYMINRDDKKCVERLGEDALELLKEQEAVKIEVKKINNSGRCGRCPNCLMELNEMDYPNYCGNCGQEVKWE